MIFTNIGGRCMGHYSFNFLHQFDESYKKLDCPTGNMLYKHGFSDTYKLFNGEFYDTLFVNGKPKKIASKYQEYNTRIGDLLIAHGLYFDKKYQNELQRRFNLFNIAIKDKNNNIIYTYTLNEHDVNKSEREILQAAKKLSKYININNLFILASIPIENENYKHFKYDYRNENFKKIFGNRYFVIEPSNDHFEACKDFVNKFNKYVKANKQRK